MNYIGSKLKLSEFLKKVICEVAGKDLSAKVFCDGFAGTGIVGRTFKPFVKQVISNDIEYYSFVLNRNYIGNCSEIANSQGLIKRLNAVPLEKDGFIFQNYCMGSGSERQYFSDYNGQKIDSVRKEIERLMNTNEINVNAYFFLLCSLLECADKLANTTSVYGAFLKNIKKTAQKELIIQPANFEKTNQQNLVFQKDINQLIQQIDGDILYLDPPYNERQYGANYHLLNTIAEYKPFIPKGKTGMRNYERSKYCMRKKVADELNSLIATAKFKYIFLSYNNEGLLSLAEIRKIMERYGHYDLAQTNYQRYKADANRFNKADATIEYLHILEKN
jgi:adenine-specific DNA-methyltransferase